MLLLISRCRHLLRNLHVVLWAACSLLIASPSIASEPHAANTTAVAEAPLIIGGRTIHVFRAPLGAFTAAERAEGARQHITRALTGPGEGWTSIKSAGEGILVELDGKPMFTVVPGDARKLSDETAQDLANQASRVLNKVWNEARERRDTRASLIGLGKSALALLLLVLALAALVKASLLIQAAWSARLAGRLKNLSDSGVSALFATLFLNVFSKSCALISWMLGLFAVFLFLTYALDQFAHTRSISENMAHSLENLLTGVASSAITAIPGLFIACVIFVIARVITRISRAMFDQVAAGRFKLGMLDNHTAPPTRRIVNAAVWLFALAMAYPYLPGAQTEAFKGLSVILGLMVSIGASGLIAQIASGMMLVYTHALMVGEYVRIQDCEGTVTELGLFVTRLRTGMGEEIALPNSLVLANVTRNFSRPVKGRGFVLDTTVTIGYDTPWRQVHAMLIDAAKQVPELTSEPAPYVVQTALSDFYVHYRLVACADVLTPTARASVISALHAAIQDAFNKHGVQIMSPHYFKDPDKPKIVREPDWFAPPASTTSQTSQ